MLKLNTLVVCCSLPLLAGCGSGRLDQIEQDMQNMKSQIRSVRVEYANNDMILQRDMQTNFNSLKAESTSTREKINEKLLIIDRILVEHSKELDKICITFGNGQVASVYVCPNYALE